MIHLPESIRFLADISLWLSAGGLIAIGAMVAGWYLPPFRNLCVAIAVAALSSTFFLAKGVYLGQSLADARCQAEAAKALNAGVKARADAERDVNSGGVRGRDEYDRDHQ